MQGRGVTTRERETHHSLIGGGGSSSFLPFSFVVVTPLLLISSTFPLACTFGGGRFSLLILSIFLVMASALLGAPLAGRRASVAQHSRAGGQDRCCLPDHFCGKEEEEEEEEKEACQAVCLLWIFLHDLFSSGSPCLVSGCRLRLLGATEDTPVHKSAGGFLDDSGFFLRDGGPQIL